MSLLKRLFEGQARILEKKGKEFLARAIRQAETDNYVVKFTGAYNQAVINSEATLRVPFVIAQKPDQTEKLEQGTLEGRIYELRRWAAVTGTISPESVQFEKMYDEASIKKGIIFKVAKRLVGGNPEGRVLNPYPITYSGSKQADGSGIYRGMWKFDAPKSGLETQGSFSMQEYFKPAAVK